MIIWLTGLPGAGKSTLSEALAEKMRIDGINPLLIDGDVMRSGLSADLGFSKEERSENIRRAGSVAVLAARSRVVTICSLISPFRKDREIVRTMAQASGVNFFEIFVDAPLELCEQRDPKGLYKMAREGRIHNFTGVSSPYETPNNPDLVVKTGEQSVRESLGHIYLKVAEMEFYKKSSVSGINKLISNIAIRITALTAKIKDNRFLAMAGWWFPFAFLCAVLSYDLFQPGVITPISMEMFLMISALMLRPSKMIVWGTIYTLVDFIIYAYRPSYILLNSSNVGFNLFNCGLHMTNFIITAFFAFLISLLLTNLRDKVGSFTMILAPRTYKI